MKKISALLFAILLANTFAFAASAKKTVKIKNSRIVEAKQDTTVNYAGVKIFIPAVQTVLLGQRENGSIVIRGLNIKNLKIDEATLSTEGYSVLSYQPTTQVIFLNRGELMTITDTNGVSATVGQSGAIATTNAAINSDTVAAMKIAAQQEAIAAAQELPDVPPFIEEEILDNAAARQAAQDVEETLSPSAPR